MTNKIHWGILGTGNIARQFAEGLRVLPDAELAAVGSRARETAERFGAEFGVPRCHASYEALAADPDVDVIYVATPHALHCENSLLALRAGKAVLCEKPFTINAAQAAEVIAVARAQNCFLMEAMWTRFIPAIGQARKWISEGAIGEPRMLQANFGFRGEGDELKLLLDPALGGGSLLDVGVYPVALASMVFGGPPSRIASLADLGSAGVDEQAGMILGYDGGALAVLSCAVRTKSYYDAHILGTEGRITIHTPFWCPERVTLSVPDKEDFEVNLPLTGNGYNYEAAEVMRAMREGRLESDLMPLDETQQIMQTLDAIRAQWGLVYPMEPVEK